MVIFRKFPMLFLIIWGAVLCSCKNKSEEKHLSYNSKKATEQMTHRKFDYPKAWEDMLRERNNRIPFTLNFEGSHGKPVITVNAEYKLCMLIDSGSTSNWFYKSFLDKIKLSEEDFIKKAIENLKTKEPQIFENYKSKDELAEFLTNKWLEFKYLPSMTFNDDVLLYYYNKKEAVDGVLGSAFLQKYKRVTIDYVNQYIILNDEKLNGTALSMYKTQNQEFLIFIEYNGNKEFAMVDTGNPWFIPRHNFGDGNQNYDINDNSTYGIGYDGDVPVTPRVFRPYNNIKIGNIIYNNINGVYSTAKGLDLNKGAISHFIKLNNLGNVFFYNHVIQFDFVDMEFIIK